MNLLEKIQQELKRNPGVVVVRVSETKDTKNIPPLGHWPPLALHALGNGSHWSVHEVDVHIAPVKGLYSAQELAMFMRMLVPDEKRRIEVAPHFRETELSIGWDIFYETIGFEDISLSREASLNDPALSNELGFVDGKAACSWSTRLSYERGIFVKTYPSEHIAQDMLEGRLGKDETFGTKYTKEIPISMLKIYQGIELFEQNGYGDYQKFYRLKKRLDDLQRELLKSNGHGQEEKGFFARLFGSST